ncbi:MAG: cytochrome c oxidase accessory protein CcoG [Campylobacterales bacterium]
MAKETSSGRLKASEYLKNWTPYRIKRYWFFAIVTLFVLIAPFITINGNHLFLLSFDHKQLHLLGIAFDMQEFYLMPFLIIILFVSIFLMTALGGRVWCGWLCPQTIFRVIYRDLIETKLVGLRKRIDNKQIEPDWSKPENKVKRVIAILIWSLLSLIAASNFMWYFVPPEDFFVYILDPMEHTVLIGFILVLTGFLIYDVIGLKENFCTYICPYVRIQSVMYDNDTIMAIYDTGRGGNVYTKDGEYIWSKGWEGECTGCEACVKVCPTHIDIRKGLQLECINCLECVDACTKVMASFNKPSLVNWSSTTATAEGNKVRYIRPRTIIYAAILAASFVALLIMGSKKEHMLLNINRGSELYQIKEGNVVTNSYIFLFQNTDSKDHTYTFTVESHPAIKVERPAAPFKLKAGEKSKKIVILSTQEKLANNASKDTPIDITIKAYAVDDPQKIVVRREAVFFYPRADKLK